MSGRIAEVWDINDDVYYFNAEVFCEILSTFADEVSDIDLLREGMFLKSGTNSGQNCPHPIVTILILFFTFLSFLTQMLSEFTRNPPTY